MGLDVVEVVMRCEEHFGIAIADEDAERMHTVGDLYRLVCEEVGVMPVADPSPFRGVARPAANSARIVAEAWTSEDVWATVKWVVVEQLQVEEDEVTPWAEFGRDLRAD